MKEIFVRVAIIALSLFLTITLLVMILVENEDTAVSSPAVLPSFFYSDSSETLESSVETETEMIETTTENISETTAFTDITAEESTEENFSVYIEMENIPQLPELPVGCEITALTIALKYYGFDVTKEDMAKKYLPKGGNWNQKDGRVFKDSFHDYFIGDPFASGYGCFSDGIETAANEFFTDENSDFKAVNISGASPDELYEYLKQDVPVICWATDGMIPPEYHESWYDNETGEKLDWYFNEHCFVLAGVDTEKNIVTLNDPMKGIIFYDKDRFELRYKQLYSQAVILEE